MALVTGQIWTEEIPHEPGQSMTFRKLSWRELERAAQVRRQEVFALMREMGDLVGQLPRTEGQVAKEQYDHGELLKAGIVAWTYQAEVTPENIDLLDAATVEWAVSQILDAHRPRSEAERKNG